MGWNHQLGYNRKHLLGNKLFSSKSLWVNRKPL